MTDVGKKPETMDEMIARFKAGPAPSSPAEAKEQEEIRKNQEKVRAEEEKARVALNTTQPIQASTLHPTHQSPSPGIPVDMRDANHPLARDIKHPLSRDTKVTVDVTMSDLEKTQLEAMEKAERDATLNPPVPVVFPTNPPKANPNLPRMKEISVRMGELLKVYGGEGNIPVIKDHEYWTLRDEFQRLRQWN